jgi:hypothetical protein
MAASFFTFLLSSRNLSEAINGPMPLTSHHLNIKVLEKSPLLAVAFINKIEMLDAIERYTYCFKSLNRQKYGLK